MDHIHIICPCSIMSDATHLQHCIREKCAWFIQFDEKTMCAISAIAVAQLKMAHRDTNFNIIIP
jgi:hypothetical protein